MQTYLALIYMMRCSTVRTSTSEYDTAQGLLDVFDEAVVAPANEKAAQLELKKAERIQTRHVKNYKKG
jgi:hypothetical protein